MSGFWLMMYQLWDLHPNFIVDWVDTSSMAQSLSWLPASVQPLFAQPTPRGVQVPQQMLLNINAGMIVLLVVLVSWLVRRMRTLSAMLLGMTIAVGAILIAGLTANGWVLALGIVFFSLGEMLTGPKKNEYLGLIAPPGKKGLYLGYVNIPVGFGGFVGSQLAGYLYGHFGDKSVLASSTSAQHTKAGAGWDGRVGSLERVLGIARPDAVAHLQEVTGLDAGAGDESALEHLPSSIRRLAAVCADWRACGGRAGRIRTTCQALEGHERVGAATPPGKSPMYWLTSNPWRCWERTTLAGVLNGPDDLLVRVALYDQRTRVLPERVSLARARPPRPE